MKIKITVDMLLQGNGKTFPGVSVVMSTNDIGQVVVETTPKNLPTMTLGEYLHYLDKENYVREYVQFIHDAAKFLKSEVQ